MLLTKTALREAVQGVPLERRLAVAIAALGVKKQDVADAAGIESSLFSRVLTGRREASDDEREAIAKAVGLTVSDLFGEQAA